MIVQVSRRIPWLLAPAIGLGAGFLPAQTEPIPGFEYSIEGCPGTLSLPRGTPWERDVVIHLTTSENPSQEGAQAWAISLSVTGVPPLSFTTDGTLAALETQDPPGLRKPDGFNKTQVGTCGETRGAVSAVVLSLGEAVTLPPTGVAPIARLAVGGVAPGEPGEVFTGRIEFQNGCRGAGMGVFNVVTWRGASVQPELGPACVFLVEGFPAPRFLRGDPNDDGEVDISDSLFILGCKFLGTGCPGCRDAGDLNDDGVMDISDAVHGLNYLFSGGQPPGYPGPTTCGSDLTEDDLPDCSYSGCGG